MTSIDVSNDVSSDETMATINTPVAADQAPSASDASGSSGGSAPAKKRRWRSGTVAKREIKKLSRSTQLLMPKATFSRLVREITADQCSSGIRWKAEAVQAIQEAAENFITEGFMRANAAREFSGRKTLSIKDVKYTGTGGEGQQELLAAL